MALTEVSGREIATIVTTLEMRAAPAPAPLPASPLVLEAWPTPDLARYRALFRRVGAPWLWFSRLVMDDVALARIVRDPAVRVFAAIDPAGEPVGMLELDFRERRQCELSYFGLIPALNDQGHGRWLIGHALRLGWTEGIERVWVHTCTLDSPNALGFYRRHGFTAIRRTVETFPDPRLIGVLPRDAAPQVPILG